MSKNKNKSVNMKGLTTALSITMDSLFTSVDACNILKEVSDFDRDILQGYYNSASEIKDEILAINDKITKVDLTKDEALVVMDYTELLSEVNQVESLAAALSHDTVTDMIANEIESSSDDLSVELEEMKKLGIELMDAPTSKGDNNAK